MRMMTMTQPMRVWTDVLFVLSLLLLGSGSYLMWGLGPMLFLLGALLLGVVLLAQLMRGRHAQPAIRN